MSEESVSFRRRVTDFDYKNPAGHRLIRDRHRLRRNIFLLGILNNEFAKLLMPIMARENGACLGYSVALQPTPPAKALLNDQQKEIFVFYGYKFWP